MRVGVVLAILGLALITMAVLRKEREDGFDHRYEQAEERIREMVKEIDEDLEDE